MKKTSNVKKTEKKVLVFLLNIFSFFVRIFKGLLKFILDAGNQKVTVMLIPHSEKRVFTKRINLFLLFSVTFLVISVIAVMVFYGFDIKTKWDKYATLDMQSRKHEEMSGAYREMLDQIMTKHTVFNTKLQSLLGVLDSPGVRFLRSAYNEGAGSGGIPNAIESNNLTDYEKLQYSVDSLLSDYNYSSEAFDQIRQIVTNYNKILQDMPYGSPVRNVRCLITSTFGFRVHPITKALDMHTGLDMAQQPGTPIVSTQDGTVEKVEWHAAGYGWYLIISHKMGYSTLYAHLRSQPIVEPGEKVRRGQVVGYMGSTGMSTGTHVHYEVRLGNNLLDPWPFVTGLDRY